MPLQRCQWWSLFALATIFACAGGAAMALYYEQVPDYVYDPTRYVFVTDRLSDRLVVVDLDGDRQSDRQDLGMVPDILSIATDFPMMAYGSYQERQLIFFNLKKKERLRLALPSRPLDLFFIPNRQQLLVVMQDGVALADYQRLALYPLAGLESVAQFEKNHPPVFSALDGSLWVADPGRPVIYRLRVNQRDGKWQPYSLPLPDGERIGPLSVNAQGDILAFADRTGSHAYLYRPASNTLRRTVDFGDASAPPIAPYLDGTSRWVVYGDTAGRLTGVRTSGEGAPISARLSSPVEKIRGGWLNRLWVMVTDESLAVQSIATGERLNSFSLNAAISDLWVTGDGKTALIAARGGFQQVLPFDLRTGTQKRPIDLDGILQANLIRMGGNNSFCY